MKVKLGDVASFSKGAQINGDELMPDGEYSFLNGGIYPSGKWNAYNVCGRTITISEGGNSSGYVNYMEQPFWCGAHCYYLFDLKCDSKYLFYALKSQQERIMQLRSGACMPNIRKSDLARFELDIDPDISNQKTVVQILDRITRLIALREKQLAKLDEVVKARFVEMFGDYRINNKGFERFKGSELFKFSSGKFLSEEKRQDRGIPVYGGNGIAWYTDLALIEYPTIIIGRVGAQCGNIHLVEGPVWVTDNAIYIKEQKIDGLRLEFLSELMTMMDFYQYADFSGQPKITQKPLGNMLYIVPPVEMQEQFSDFVGRIDQQKLTIQQSSDKMEVLKRSLMQEYFG